MRPDPSVVDQARGMRLAAAQARARAQDMRRDDAARRARMRVALASGRGSIRVAEIDRSGHPEAPTSPA